MVHVQYMLGLQTVMLSSLCINITGLREEVHLATSEVVCKCWSSQIHTNLLSWVNTANALQYCKQVQCMFHMILNCAVHYNMKQCQIEV